MELLKNYLLGFAPHKISLVANYKIKNRLNINLNGNFFSERFGFDHANDITQSTDTETVYQDVIKKYSSVLL